MLKNVIDKVLLNRGRAITAAARDYGAACADERFYVIEKEIKELAYNYAVAADSAEQAEIEARLKVLRKNRAARLKTLGLNDVPVFDCAKCGDTGYSDKKLCACVRNALARELNKQNGVSDAAPITFADSDFSKYKEHAEYMTKVFGKLQAFCADFPNTRMRTVILYGAAGTGKTYLAACTADAITLSGYSVLFFTAFQLNNLLLKIHTAPLAEKPALFDSLLDCDMLIIDDLGSEQLYRNVTIEYLTSIIDERKRAQKHLLITTNLSPDDIMLRYGERCFSRLYDKSSSAVIEHKGASLRQPIRR
jgi:DNA replication protein DnaC